MANKSVCFFILSFFFIFLSTPWINDVSKQAMNSAALHAILKMLHSSLWIQISHINGCFSLIASVACVTLWTRWCLFDVQLCLALCLYEPVKTLCGQVSLTELLVLQCAVKFVVNEVHFFDCVQCLWKFLPFCFRFCCDFVLLLSISLHYFVWMSDYQRVQICVCVCRFLPYSEAGYCPSPHILSLEEAGHRGEDVLLLGLESGPALIYVSLKHPEYEVHRLMECLWIALFSVSLGT